MRSRLAIGPSLQVIPFQPSPTPEPESDSDSDSFAALPRIAETQWSISSRAEHRLSVAVRTHHSSSILTSTITITIHTRTSQYETREEDSSMARGDTQSAHSESVPVLNGL